jgi:hypothetical protein
MRLSQQGQSLVTWTFTDNTPERRIIGATTLEVLVGSSTPAMPISQVVVREPQV